MSSFKRSPIGSILEQIVTGSTPSTLHPEYFDGTIPWFAPSDIGISRDLVDSSRHISEFALKKGKVKHFEKGMLLVTCIGEIGRVGVLQESASSNQQITALNFCSEIDTYYAYYWFIAHQYVLQHFASQAVVPILNNGRLKDIDFTYPPLPEQKRIAAILEKADRLRRLRRYARELSDTYLQSVFLEMFGGLLHSANSNELGEVITSGPSNGLYKPETFIGSGVLFFDIKGLYDSFIAEFGYSRRIRVTEKELKQYALVSGDILVNRVSKLAEGVGKAVLVEEVPEPSVYESNMMRFRIDQRKIAPWFLVYFLASEISRRELLSKANITSQASINQDAIRSLRLVIPPTDLQGKFIKVVKATNRLRIQQLEALRQAEHLFQTLLYKAFRGGLS